MTPELRAKIAREVKFRLENYVNEATPSALYVIKKEFIAGAEFALSLRPEPIYGVDHGDIQDLIDSQNIPQQEYKVDIECKPEPGSGEDKAKIERLENLVASLQKTIVEYQRFDIGRNLTDEEKKENYPMIRMFFGDTITIERIQAWAKSQAHYIFAPDLETMLRNDCKDNLWDAFRISVKVMRRRKS